MLSRANLLYNLAYTLRASQHFIRIAFFSFEGIESFWSTTLKNVELLANMIQEKDEPLLDHLTDITVQFSEKPMV